MSTASAAELERFRSSIARRFGLQFDDAKLGFLAELLRRRLEATGQGADVYLGALEAEGSSHECRLLAQDLTVGETYFFRHIEQYRAFVEIALPERIRRACADGRTLSILSAGCATGEEPYSLAIVARDALLEQSRDVSILAVDINEASLEKAARGRFSPWVLRETSPEIRQRWFRPDGREFLLDEDVRAAVTFDVANLADDRSQPWQSRAYDIVFCRNVLMYFTPEGAQALIDRITRTLHPGGYLFLGHAETLRGLSNDFYLRHTHETFYYQRRSRVEPRISPSLAAPSTRTTSPQVMLANMVDGADTWVEAIRRASQRIETLVESRPRPGSSAERSAPPPNPIWEIGLVLELLRKERFAEALELVEAFPPESNRDPEVLLLQAVLLTHSGQFARAEYVCERLLQLDELHAGAHYLLALCRESAGDRLGSLHHDQVAVYLDPGFAMAHLHSGLVSRRAGDRATARRELGHALMLLQREDASRLLLFGGGFGRETLVALCRAELVGCGEAR